MSNIVIKRTLGISGGLCKMICYIDGEEVCRLKENETQMLKTEKSTCEFECRITANPMSEKYRIDFNKGKGVNITISQGGWKPKVTIEYMNEIQNETSLTKSISEFNPTKKIGDYLYIDETKEQWAAPKGLFRKKIQAIYSYSDVLDYELLEDGDIICKGGIGRAIVGGALFGGVGAIVGGMTGQKLKGVCTKLQIKITLNNAANPTEYITLLPTETKKDSFIYKAAYNSAQEILSMFAIMCNKNNADDEPSTPNNEYEPISSADEILKYKNLLDQGIITQEEFDAKRQKIMGI